MSPAEPTADWFRDLIAMLASAALAEIPHYHNGDQPRDGVVTVDFSVSAGGVTGLGRAVETLVSSGAEVVIGHGDPDRPRRRPGRDARRRADRAGRG
mgnify:CR=1 FL=1